jgi:CRISPR-associated protein Csd1
VRDPKDVPAPLAAKLFRVAVRAEPIPFAVMAQALARARIDFIQGNASSPARMGLIRAYFARKHRLAKGVTEMTETVQPELTEDLVSPAYHLDYAHKQRSERWPARLMLVVVEEVSSSFAGSLPS